MVTYRTLQRRFEHYAMVGHSNRRWYRVARGVIHRLADYRCELRDDYYNTLCDIVAITSPRVGVMRNLRFAWGEFNGRPRPSDMMRSIRQALEHYYSTGEIRGPKTSRFAKVLRGDDSVVVVDTWMVRALGLPDKMARNKSTQELAEKLIKNLAFRLSYCTPVGWTRAETQAAVWAGMIRTYYKSGKIPRFRLSDVLTRDADGLWVDLADVPF